MGKLILFLTFQLSALSTQNAFIQNQLAAVTQNNLPKSNLLSNVSGGVSSGDLKTLQLALQQQQQNLQQQLQSFLLMQPGTAQASAVLLHAQVQQAVTQATNQLKILQTQRDAQQQQQEHLAQVSQVLPDTPKSIPRSSPFESVTSRIPVLSNIKNTSEINSPSRFPSNANSSNAIKFGQNKAALKAALLKHQPKPNVSEALSNLLPIPPPRSTAPTATSFLPLSSPNNHVTKPFIPSTSPPSPPLFTNLPSPMTSRPIPLSSTSSFSTSSPNNIMVAQNGFPRFSSIPLIPQQQPIVPRLDLPADENVDLEELEQFAKEFKQRRIKLGEYKLIIVKCKISA